MAASIVMIMAVCCWHARALASCYHCMTVPNVLPWALPLLKDAGMDAGAGRLSKSYRNLLDTLTSASRIILVLSWWILQRYLVVMTIIVEMKLGKSSSISIIG